MPRAGFVRLGSGKLRIGSRRRELSAVVITPFILALIVCTLTFRGGGSNVLSSPSNPPSSQTQTQSDTETLPPGHVAVGDFAKARARTQSSGTDTGFCNAATDKTPCIFDFGFNAGQSSAFYLQDPSARVLAVEANPLLVRAGRERFQKETSAGRFKLLERGVSLFKTNEKLQFWVNNHNSKYSSFMKSQGCRAKNGSVINWSPNFCHSIDVQMSTCDQMLIEYGTPIYLKVDIEGHDRACLKSLSKLAVKDRPRYVSKENIALADIQLLNSLGYDGFKVVGQMALERKYKNDPSMRGTSGPWGEDALDTVSGTVWQSYEQLLARLPLNNKKGVDWYDIHAKRK